MTIAQCPSIGSPYITPEDKALITQEIVSTFSSEFNGLAQENPVVVLLGGFQGSGKSTIAEHLQKKHQFTVISTDAIRYKLLEKNIGGDLFAEMVSSIWKVLLIIAVKKRLNIVIDANAHEKRIGEVSRLLKPSRMYKMVKIFLYAPEETLIERLESRPKAEGSYQGQIADLKGSLVTSKVNVSDYDRVLRTDVLTIVEEFRSVDALLAEILQLEREV